MYVAVDNGGTKTIIAVLDSHGVIQEQIKFPTSRDYDQFVKDLKEAKSKLKIQEYSAGVGGVTGPKTDRINGIGISFSNLPWKNAPLLKDFEETFKCPMAIENDAKLAGLSEAMLIKDEYSKVLYMTVSTGIGFGLINGGVIDENIGDAGGDAIMLEHEGKMISWEDFASGKAIVERYGKKASDINDEQTWKSIAKDLAKGIIHLIAIMQPEVIVFGGGVGEHFEQFGKFLEEDINDYALPLIDVPKLIKAQRPEFAVIYGCYDLAKQKFPHAYNHN
jgi:glucokinase